MNVVEDEHNFPLECTLNVDIREELITACNQLNTGFNHLSKEEKIEFILGNYIVLSDSVQYVTAAFNRRKCINV